MQIPLRIALKRYSLKPKVAPRFQDVQGKIYDSSEMEGQQLGSVLFINFVKDKKKKEAKIIHMIISRNEGI